MIPEQIREHLSLKAAFQFVAVGNKDVGIAGCSK